MIVAGSCITARIKIISVHNPAAGTPTTSIPRPAARDAADARRSELSHLGPFLPCDQECDLASQLGSAVAVRQQRARDEDRDDEHQKTESQVAYCRDHPHAQVLEVRGELGQCRLEILGRAQPELIQTITDERPIGDGLRWRRKFDLVAFEIVGQPRG
jgi:hypothetical protein